MHRAVKAMWIVLPSVVTPSRSPNKQTKGEAGIEHLRHFDKSSQILYQYRTGEQVDRTIERGYNCQVYCLYSVSSC